MVTRGLFTQLLVSSIVLALGASSAAAQVSIEVVASAQRDGISVQNRRQQIGIAEDGTIAFGASTASAFDRLFVAHPGGTAVDQGWSASNGADVAINDDSIVFIAGPQVVALSRVSLSVPSVVQDCLDPMTPCGGVQHLSMSSDGYFAMTAFDSSGGIYRGRVQKGWLRTVLEPVPVLPSLITALGIDVRVGGPMLILGDHSASNAEVYGAFLSTPSRWGYFINTAVSTRPRGGNEAPVSASYGNYQTFALMPAQTDGLGTTLAGPALVRGATQPYGTLQVAGTPLLPLQSVAGGSMDTNDLGLAAVVATLPSGWAGLFTYDTAAAGAAPVPLTPLHAGFGRRCFDAPIALHVLGTNNAGQIAVLARVQSNAGVVDTQIWRVTPTPTLGTTISYCMSRRILWPWP